MHTGLSKYYRPQDTYAGNLLGAAEALDSGITTLLDWSHTPAPLPNHTDGADQAGLRRRRRADRLRATAAARRAVGARFPATPRRIRPMTCGACASQYFSSDAMG